MRCHWIGSILTILASLGLSVVIMGQYQELLKLGKQSEEIQTQVNIVHDRLVNGHLFRASVEKTMEEGKKAQTELEPSLAQATSEMEKKKTEKDACEAEKKTKNDALAEKEKARTDTAASLKTESDAWNNEISSLKNQLSGHRPICDFVKNDTLAKKLCGIETP